MRHSSAQAACVRLCQSCTLGIFTASVAADSKLADVCQLSILSSRTASRSGVTACPVTMVESTGRKQHLQRTACTALHAQLRSGCAKRLAPTFRANSPDFSVTSCGLALAHSPSCCWPCGVLVAAAGWGGACCCGAAARRTCWARRCCSCSRRLCWQLDPQRWTPILVARIVIRGGVRAAG